MYVKINRCDNRAKYLHRLPHPNIITQVHIHSNHQRQMTHPTVEVASRLNIRGLAAERITPLSMCLIDEDISNKWASSDG